MRSPNQFSATNKPSEFQHFFYHIDVGHECVTEFGVFPETDVVDIKKSKFLVKYDLSDNLLCQLCTTKCNKIILYTVTTFTVQLSLVPMYYT